jgi:hypothetical protein
LGWKSGNDLLIKAPGLIVVDETLIVPSVRVKYIKNASERKGKITNTCGVAVIYYNFTGSFIIFQFHLAANCHHES